MVKNLLNSASIMVLALCVSLPGSTETTVPASSGITIPGAVHQAPAVYRFTIGDAQVTALDDGTMPLDLHQMLKGITPAETDALLAQNFLANPVHPSINAFLIEMEGRTILVDTGSGDLFGPNSSVGRLPEALTFANINPEQIDNILITHAHPDHIGGLIRNGRIVFPKATIHVGQADLDFFLNPQDSSNQRTSELVKAMFKPYMDAGKVRGFEKDGEILPGINAELRPGHSPGSAIFRLMSRGQELVIIGDIIHVAAVQFSRTDVTFLFDQDPAQARTDREEILERFARDSTLFASPHLSFPGIGYIRAEDSGYRWFPVEYANQSQGLSAIKFKGAD